MSERQQTAKSFANEYEFSDYDIENRVLPWLDTKIHKWFEKKELKRHRFLGFKSGYDIEGADGSRPFYEHKADRWYGVKSLNVLIEAYKKKRNGGGHVQSWMFTCGADYMIVTSAVDIRVYRWNGEYGLQWELVNNMEVLYSRFATLSGDDNVMESFKIPECKLRRWLVYKGVWDNRTEVDELVRYRNSKDKPVREAEEAPGQIYKYYKHSNNEP